MRDGLSNTQVIRGADQTLSGVRQTLRQLLTFAALALLSLILQRAL